MSNFMYVVRVGLLGIYFLIGNAVIFIYALFQKKILCAEFVFKMKFT